MNTRTVSNKDITPEEHLRQLLHVFLKQDGGNPSRLLEILATITEMEIWTRYGMTFREFIQIPYNQGGVGWTIDDVEKIITFQHRYEIPPHRSEQIAQQMETMRKRVRDLLVEDIEPLAEHGTNQHDGGLYNVNSSRQQASGNNAVYTLKRLKRDRPDLAEQVIAGEISTNQAAIEAGIRKRPIQIVPEDVKATARKLKKYMTDEQIRSR